jgi:hypothetical protein
MEIENSKYRVLTTTLFYEIMNLQRDELSATLQTWTRTELIEWLCWNDRNGVYKDKETMQEFGYIVSKEEAMEIITRQILQDEYK